MILKKLVFKPKTYKCFIFFFFTMKIFLEHWEKKALPLIYITSVEGSCQYTLINKIRN